MEHNNSKILMQSDSLFDKYFETMNLDSDIKKIYQLIGDEELQDEFERKAYLNKLRNDNHLRYYDINITKLEKLPYDFDEIIKDIITLYGYIDYKKLLTENLEESENNKKILDNIYRKLARLDKVVKNKSKELNKLNDDRQSKFNINYFKTLDIDDDLRKKLLKKYNDLVLYNSVIVQDCYDDLTRQIKRNDYINEILNLLNIDQEKKLSISRQKKLDILNVKIKKEIEKYLNKINYLEDLIPYDSKYLQEFNEFKNLFYKFIAYNDKDYNSAKKTYEKLCDNIRFNDQIKFFESEFIKEIENKKEEEKFVYEKVGVKNIKTTINYITSNYLEVLDDDSKKVLDHVHEKLKTKNYNLKEIEKVVGLIVNEIWNNTITDVYSYNPQDDYYFICSNNQFIDEKYQTILITKREIEKVNDYLDYQIGFICEYNNNILYITENEDITTVNYNDMSNLKTPIQLEQEFFNFKICNRIALDGFKTKIAAVYCINDGNFDIYNKAVTLANMYKLPLIEIKK